MGGGPRDIFADLPFNRCSRAGTTSASRHTTGTSRHPQTLKELTEFIKFKSKMNPEPRKRKKKHKEICGCLLVKHSVLTSCTSG